MTWVKSALQQLSENEECKIRPLGGSMRGRIESGQLVTILKATFNDVNIEDVVFIKWKNNYLLHIIKDIKDDDILIGNNLGKINGWVSSDAIIGKVINVED